MKDGAQMSRRDTTHREVGIDQAQLVLEAFSDARDKVLDVRDDCAEAGQRLAPARVIVHLKLLLAILLHQEHVHGDVLEIP
jgi:hypothetical protein